MTTILAIDLGKRNSVFCKLDTSSLKTEYFTLRTNQETNTSEQKHRTAKLQESEAIRPNKAIP